MSVIKKFVGESLVGVRLEAVIVKEDGAPYSIRYYVNDKFKQEEIFENQSLYYVEDAAENWLKGVKTLNG
jgi:hypothetical protein